MNASLALTSQDAATLAIAAAALTSPSLNISSLPPDYVTKYGLRSMEAGISLPPALMAPPAPPPSPVPPLPALAPGSGQPRSAPSMLLLPGALIGSSKPCRLSYKL